MADEKEYPWEHHGEWSSRILEVDPVTKTKEVYFYNRYDDTQCIQHVQDIKSALEVTKASYAATDSHAPWSFDEENELGRKVAWMPDSVWLDLWKRSNGGKDQEVLNRWVMDNENRHFLYRPVLRGVGKATGGDITR